MHSTCAVRNRLPVWTALMGLLLASACLAGGSQHGLERWQWPSRGYLTGGYAPRSPFNIGQIKPGARVPALRAQTETGQPVDLEAALRKGPTVLVFYQSRGCGHCNWQFAQAMDARQELRSLGYQLIAVSKVEAIDPAQTEPMAKRVLTRSWPPYAPLELERLENEYAALPRTPFLVISDADLRLGKAFGVTFDRDDPIHLTYPQRGDMVKMGFNESTGGYYGPAVFVVDSDRRVLYEWTYNDHKVRVGAETLVAIAQHCSDRANLPVFGLGKALEDPQSVTRLSLAGMGLEELPPGVLSLRNLKELILYDNRLTELPPGIGALAHLETLDLTKNRLKELPPEIGQLRELQNLQLLGNQLRTLPAEIAKLQNLHTLNLMFNPVEFLPSQIGELGQLRYLRLYGHRLQSLPASIGQLKKLRMLFAPGTKLGKKNDVSARVIGLEELPPEIGGLENLIELNLIFNNLVELPSEIGRLQKLEFLHLDENNLASLPPELGDIAALGSTLFSEGIYMRDNRLRALPPELGQQNGIIRLDASYNLLAELSPAAARNVGKTSWGSIDISHNRLVNVPGELFVSDGISAVNLSHNRIRELPAKLPGPVKARFVDISYNVLANLPLWLEQVSRLEASHNPVTSESQTAQ